MENTDLTPLERAQAALRDKQQAIAKHQDAIQKFQAEAEELLTVVKWLERLERGNPTDPARGNGRVTKAQEAGDFACALVDQKGPLSISEIYGPFVHAGHELAGKTEGDKRVTLSGLLGRDGRLSHHKAFGRWWFADRAYPVATASSLPSRDEVRVGGQMDVAGIHSPIHSRKGLLQQIALEEARRDAKLKSRE
jgi:hypothetical protein